MGLGSWLAGREAGPLRGGHPCCTCLFVVSGRASQQQQHASREKEEPFHRIGVVGRLGIMLLLLLLYITYRYHYHGSTFTPILSGLDLETHLERNLRLAASLCAATTSSALAPFELAVANDGAHTHAPHRPAAGDGDKPMTPMPNCPT